MKTSKLLTVITTGIWLIAPSMVSAHIKGVAKQTTRNVPVKNQAIAQTFYPPVSNRQGLMVQGQGEASAPADRANIQLFLASQIRRISPSRKTPTPTKQGSLTRATLQPIIDAIVTQGVPSNNIDVNIGASASYSGYPYRQNPNNAQLSVKVSQPTQEKIQEIVKVANKTIATNKDFILRRINVNYEVDDCQALEKQAYIAAVKDAQNRANILAQAMNVKIVTTPSIMESPWSNFFPSAAASNCSSKSVFSFYHLVLSNNPIMPLNHRK
ncbi:SIMPL domain-containing protein [Calothrix rhizosoleniae]|uniref:SIMPL domain-containing protein n=1 Tax=Calothrix rhizosoleniae TaxID=888997 RepID=UPI000B49C169|nr:SIMPL domain-containing protein [Calothrix rhizosoleniae]